MNILISWLNFLFQLILLLMNSRSSDYSSLANNFLLINSNLENLLEQHFVGLLFKLKRVLGLESLLQILLECSIILPATLISI